jgi:hypothetical protein
MDADVSRVLGGTLAFPASESSRAFGSAVIETVDQEWRVPMNAGKARPAVAGPIRRPANLREQVSARGSVKTPYARSHRRSRLVDRERSVHPLCA